MKHLYLLIFLFSVAFMYGQSCPPNAFASESKIYFTDDTGSIVCGTLPGSITAEGITYTQESCYPTLATYTTTDTPVADNVAFTADFGGAIGSCYYAANGTLPIDEFILKTSLNIYPNPIQSGNLLKVSFGLPITGKMELYSITGKMELKSDINKNLEKELNLSGINNGIYLLKISTETSYVTRKVIIMK